MALYTETFEGMVPGDEPYPNLFSVLPNIAGAPYAWNRSVVTDDSSLSGSKSISPGLIAEDYDGLPGVTRYTNFVTAIVPHSSEELTVSGYVYLDPETLGDGTTDLLLLCPIKFQLPGDPRILETVLQFGMAQTFSGSGTAYKELIFTNTQGFIVGDGSGYTQVGWYYYEVSIRGFAELAETKGRVNTPTGEVAFEYDWVSPYQEYIDQGYVFSPSESSPEYSNKWLVTYDCPENSRWDDATALTVEGVSSAPKVRMYPIHN